MASKQQPASYRGRRRLPKLPSRRYAAVVTTAFLGAGVVALSAGAVIPESASANGSSDSSTQAMSIQDSLSAKDKANRSQDRPTASDALEQGKPDVWLLPVPTKFEITTLFAMRWGTMHYGVDMAAPKGTPYYATHSGTVELAGLDAGYGLCIKIDHGNGIESVYGHSSKLLVTAGQHVEAGQLIGLIGSTGDSTGNHLHFEINVNGTHLDPIKYLLPRGVDIQKRLEAANGGNVIT